MTQADLVEAARAVFAKTGAEMIDPDYALPSDVPLELSGEAVRARLCVFTNERGKEMVMRPDLTLPIAQREANRRAGGGNGAKAYAYAARAFRLPATSSDPLEFTQVGFEWFGRDSLPGEDVNAFILIQQAIEACGVQPVSTETGDLSIFPAFVDALDLAPITSDLLKRAFRQDGGVSEMLNAPVRPVPEDLLPALEAETAGDAETLFLTALEGRNIPMIGTRGVSEIIAGLKQRKAAHAAGGVPEAARAALEDLERVNCTAAEAAESLSAVSRAHGISGVAPVIERLAQRTSAILSAIGDAAGEVRFRSDYGRRFTYYDGFVFEILGERSGVPQPLGSGGRYDGLIEGLAQGQVSASGVGGMVRPDRILKVKEGGPA